MGCGDASGPSPEPVPHTPISPPPPAAPAAADSPADDPVVPAGPPVPDATLHFGSTRLAFLVSSRANEIEPETVHLYNDTAATVRVTSFGLADDPSSPFGAGAADTFSAEGAALPITLQPGAAALFTLHFTPVDDLMRAGFFVTTTDSPLAPLLELPLLGKVYLDPRDSTGN